MRVVFAGFFNFFKNKKVFYIDMTQIKQLNMFIRIKYFLICDCFSCRYYFWYIFVLINVVKQSIQVYTRNIYL